MSSDNDKAAAHAVKTVNPKMKIVNDESAEYSLKNNHVLRRR